MKTFLKSGICLFLCLIFMLSVVSCNKDPNDKVTDPSDLVADTEETNPEEEDVFSEEVLYKPVEKNYNREFAMALRDKHVFECFGVAEDYKLGQGSVVSDALFERNLLMEEKYGVIVTTTVVSTTDYRTAALGGSKVCDVYSSGATFLVPLVLEGFFVDLNTLDSLNLSASYWGQNAREEFNLMGSLYFIEGDYEFRNENVLPGIIYNEKIWADRGFYTTYGTPYDLVKQGKWTWETMLTMIDGMYTDLNSNDTVDIEDSFGIVTDPGMVSALLLSAGIKTLDCNDGGVTFTLNDPTYWDRFYNTLNDIVETYYNDVDIVMNNDLKNDFTGISNMVMEDRVLFRYTSLDVVFDLGDMAARWGILPVPKYDENSDYICYEVGSMAYMTGISKNTSDKEETAAIFETLNYHSRYGTNSVYSAYFENFRLRKFCETEEDMEMLQFVASRLSHNADSAFQATGVQSAITPFVNPRQDITGLYSHFTSLKESAKTKTEDLLTKILVLQSKNN